MSTLKTLLVTGGAGFIGSNYVRHVLETRKDTKIVVLDALTYAGSTDNLPLAEHPDRLQFCYGNILNSDLLDRLVARADEIIHFAAESHVARSIADARAFVETDMLGTQVVCAAVTKHRATVARFVHISTSEVYGSAIDDSVPMNEDHPLNPASPYAAAKAGADRLVWSYWNTYGIPVVIVRPNNQMGPNQHLEKAVPRFITSALLDQPLTVHGGGQSKRDWLYVEDLCRGLELVFDYPGRGIHGEVFNFGSGTAVSIECIAQTVLGIMGLPHSRIRLTDDRPGQVGCHRCDYTKAHETFGWEPAIDLEDGLALTVNWYGNNEAWWKQRMHMRQVEIELPDGRSVMH